MAAILARNSACVGPWTQDTSCPPPLSRASKRWPCLAVLPMQVRRSSYHDVVRQQDIAKLADVSGIQSYTINGARVLFLRRRPQPRPPKGAVGASQCTVCSRHLQVGGPIVGQTAATASVDSSAGWKP